MTASLALRRSHLMCRTAYWPLILACSLLGAVARQALPPPRDPLMALMLSQPRIDVDSPVTATATFDPPVVRPGEPATYRVTFNALEESIEWPNKPAAPPELNLQPGGRGQILQMVGPNLQPRTSFNYHARVSRPGQFTVPGSTITVYGKPVAVPPAQLEVSPAASPLIRSANRLIFDIATTNLYVGQAVRASVSSVGLPGGIVRSVTQVQLSGPGIIADLGAAHQRIEMNPRNEFGTNLPMFIFETSLIPLTTGKIPVFAQGFTEDRGVARPSATPGPGGVTVTQPQFILVDSEPIELVVQALPRSGQLPGFTGAIGVYKLAAPTLSTNVVRVGEAVKLTVKVLGDANSNLARLVAPPPPRARDWQVFAATSDNLPPQAIQMQGFARFDFTLIPLSEQSRSTPAIPFSYFDAARGEYADLTIPAVPITVVAGSAPADLQAALQLEAAEAETEKEPGLSDLALKLGRTGGRLAPLQQQAWFPIVQLAPGVVILGLWGWDRRRRHLENHPEIILRRRARRALRRQWRLLRRAARAGDARGFAAAATSALREACAPHYPAEPRALVGGDVLLVLPGAELDGQGREVVRRFFAITDAASFGLPQTDATPLLALQPELEHVLEQLEERL